jgi:hypothetical protein
VEVRLKLRDVDSALAHGRDLGVGHPAAAVIGLQAGYGQDADPLAGVDVMNGSREHGVLTHH